MTQVGERITCTARIVGKQDRRVRLQLQSANPDGVVKLSAEALIAWP